MNHIIFETADRYSIALLVKPTSMHKTDLMHHYVSPLNTLGIPSTEIIAFDLEHNEHGKSTATLRKEYLAHLLKALRSLDILTLIVCDGDYFKTLTKEKKSEPHYGDVLPCAIKDFEDFKVILAPNHKALFYNPAVQQKLDLALQTVMHNANGTYTKLGSGIIHSEQYPEYYHEIATALQQLHQYPVLTCDFETFSLKFWETGIGTVSFAWDQHNGVAFAVDTTDSSTVEFKANLPVRQLLRSFFEDYTGTLIWHNANFDLKIAVSTLWMKDLLDERGKQEGMEVMCRDFHDTKIITYLATNSTAGNKLSLKDVAHEFAGNWANSDINDITFIEKPTLLRYNLVDSLCTWYAFNKHYPTMIEDQQEDVYNTIMKPSVKVILQMELTGMPINMAKVADARVILETEIQGCVELLAQSDIIHKFEIRNTDNAYEKDYQDRKAKAVHPDKIQYKDRVEFKTVPFNPGSSTQLIELLFTMLALPVLDTTDTKLPSTGAKTLKKLIHQTNDKGILAILDAVIRFSEASKILNTFIVAFEGAILKANGWYYLHGNFNLGGTVSGRLSSSGPNLQNIPSTGSRFAGIIKECFEAPPGYLFVGADFSSLEDRISALITKDPQKLRVYTDGYDGHCLRAYAYWPEKMPDITNTVESINSIATKYKSIRQDSKTPTFALTYGGTFHAIMDQTGLAKAAAQAIETNYHELYVVSDQWVAEKIKEATVNGYITVAFGLRVRTPVLSQVLWNSRHTPYEAQAEGRTAGNALGQSYGLLNNRAGIEFQERVLTSEYSETVLPVAQIHDAIYAIVEDCLETVHWVNINLVECMQWQGLKEIFHPDVPLGGDMDIFYPNWSVSITLDNNSTPQKIISKCNS